MDLTPFFSALLSTGILKRGLIGLTLSVSLGLGFGAFIGWATRRSRSESAVLLALACSLISIGAGFTDGASAGAALAATTVATMEAIFALIVPILLLRYAPVLWAWLSMLVVPVATITLGVVAIAAAVDAPINPVVVDPKPEAPDAGPADPLPAVVRMVCLEITATELLERAYTYTGGEAAFCPAGADGLPVVPSCPGGYAHVPVMGRCFLSDADIPQPNRDDVSGPETPCLCVSGADTRDKSGACTWNDPTRAKAGIDGLTVACVCPSGYTHAENGSGAPCKAVGPEPVSPDGPVPPKTGGAL